MIIGDKCSRHRLVFVNFLDASVKLAKLFIRLMQREKLKRRLQEEEQQRMRFAQARRLQEQREKLQVQREREKEALKERCSLEISEWKKVKEEQKKSLSLLSSIQFAERDIVFDTVRYVIKKEDGSVALCHNTRPASFEVFAEHCEELRHRGYISSKSRLDSGRFRVKVRPQFVEDFVVKKSEATFFPEINDVLHFRLPNGKEQFALVVSPMENLPSPMETSIDYADRTPTRQRSFRTPRHTSLARTEVEVHLPPLPKTEPHFKTNKVSSNSSKIQNPAVAAEEIFTPAGLVEVD